MSAPARGGMWAEPNVTPMIDVLLVLLVIFMLIVPQVRRAIDARLPVPAAGGDAEPASITVQAFGDGRYAVEGDPEADGRLTAPALLRRLRALHASSPDAPLFVKGAEGARYADVFAALDVARGAGVRLVALTPRGEEGAARK